MIEPRSLQDVPHDERRERRTGSPVTENAPVSPEEVVETIEAYKRARESAESPKSPSL